MRWERSPSASLPVPRISSASGARKPAQQQHHQRERGEDGQRGMDLADALEPAQELRRVGIDPDHLGGLVGDADLDQLVELLVDAALEQIDQPSARRRRDGRGCATARPRRADRACAGIPARICVEPRELGGFGLALLGRRRWRALSRSASWSAARSESITLLQIGGAEGPVGDPGQQRVGPGLEQLLAVARELELPLKLLMGDARAGEIAMRLGHAPIGERGRRKRHGKKQSGGDEELRLVTHRNSQGPLAANGRERARFPQPGRRAVPRRRVNSRILYSAFPLILEGVLQHTS